jgi:hypothetical protein
VCLLHLLPLFLLLLLLVGISMLHLLLVVALLEQKEGR